MDKDRDEEVDQRFSHNSILLRLDQGPVVFDGDMIAIRVQRKTPSVDMIRSTQLTIL